jgi:hypothetical protein
MISLRQKNSDVLRRFRSLITHVTLVTFLGMCISLLPIGKAPVLFAQQISTIPGSFVDVGFGTRPVAMGYAFVGLADDENATYWNPAGLTKADGFQVGLSQLDHWGLVTYNYAAITVPSFGQNQALGIAVISSGDDMMSELSVHAAYGFRVRFVSIGASIKYRSASFGKNTLSENSYLVFDPEEISIGMGQQVTGNAFGLGLDLGVLVHINESIQIGMMARDYKAPMQWSSSAVESSVYSAKGDYAEDLPMELLFGVSGRIGDELTLVADYVPALENDRTTWVRAGFEKRLAKVLMIRGGTEQGINNLEDDKITLGTGLDISIQQALRIKADFTYVMDPIKDSHRFSFSIHF